MVCKHCGHALGSNMAICPNCGAMMTNDQLKERKEMNGANNAYAKRLEDLNNKNMAYKTGQKNNTSNVNIGKYIALALVVIAIIIIFILFRK